MFADNVLRRILLIPNIKLSQEDIASLKHQVLRLEQLGYTENEAFQQAGCGVDALRLTRADFDYLLAGSVDLSCSNQANYHRIYIGLVAIFVPPANPRTGPLFRFSNDCPRPSRCDCDYPAPDEEFLWI